MLKRIMTLFAAGYALVLALVLVLGLQAIASMDRLHTATNDLYAHPFTVNNAALEAQTNILWMRDNMLDMAVSNDPQEIMKLLPEIVSRDKNVRKKIGVVEIAFLGDIGKVQEVKRLLDEWQQLRTREIDLVKQGKKEMADGLVTDPGARIFDQLTADMDYVIGFTRQRAAVFIAEADKTAEISINRTRWLLAGLIATISATGWFVVRRMATIIRRQEEVGQALKQHSARLTAVNKELESFSYSISHDLRVPLRAIDGFSSILLDEYQDKLDAEGKRLLNVVRNNTKRMAQLIDDILAFSRTGSVEMMPAEISMEDLAHDVMAELKPVIAGREVRIEIKPLPPVHADHAMMHQVFVNLLSNAIKFTRQKTVAQIEVGAGSGEKEVIYYVRDNGVGFDMQYVDKLFGMFMRLHGVDEFEGTGIGLAIVKRIINRHGGRVWAEGKINGGATVYFALPIKGENHG